MARSIKSDLELLIGFENGYSKETKPNQTKTVLSKQWKLRDFLKNCLSIHKCQVKSAEYCSDSIFLKVSHPFLMENGEIPCGDIVQFKVLWRQNTKHHFLQNTPFHQGIFNQHASERTELSSTIFNVNDCWLAGVAILLSGDIFQWFSSD